MSNLAFILTTFLIKMLFPISKKYFSFFLEMGKILQRIRYALLNSHWRIGDKRVIRVADSLTEPTEV